MTVIIERNIPFTGEIERLAEIFHVKEDSYVYQRAAELLEEAKAIARPCLLIKKVPLEMAGGQVIAGGWPLESKIVAQKLEQARELYVYVISCGREISDYLGKIKDDMDHFIVDQIAYLAYQSAREHFRLCVERQITSQRYIMLAPGSVIDWSVAESKKLFKLLDGDYQGLGLEILASGLINPLKSTCGLLAEAAEEFSSCELCPRLKCPSRAAEFDPKKHEAAMGGAEEKEE